MSKDFNFPEKYCGQDETENINRRLLALYTQWYDKCFKAIESEYADLSLNAPFLLTCTDEYLGNRVMLFGQEAHDTSSSLRDFHLDQYLNPESYSYEEYIHGEKKHPEGRRNLMSTNFLKTRKICAGIESDVKFINNEAAYKQFTSVLVNNLNKLSYGGKSTPVDKRLNDFYKQFTFDEEEGNIFFHEFRILKPEKIVFATGSYIKHLERAFGKEVADQLKGSWQTLSLRKDGPHKTISDPGQFVFAGITIKYIYGYHPNAHLKDADRKSYENSIKNFVNT